MLRPIGLTSGQAKGDERDPEKVATFKGDRPANPRLYKTLCWLETARERGSDVSGIIGGGGTINNGLRGGT